jgi:hypothetical protein
MEDFPGIFFSLVVSFRFFLFASVYGRLCLFFSRLVAVTTSSGSVSGTGKGRGAMSTQAGIASTKVIILVLGAGKLFTAKLI